MGNKFIFTAGVVGILTGVASGAMDGSEVDYGREYNPYVTLRGGAFGGDARSDFSINTRLKSNKNLKENIKNAWSGSGEFGIACFDERVFVGLELGYFTEKATFELRGSGGKLIFPAEFGNTFGACNVTLRHYFCERGFWYGGVGAGIARVSVTAGMLMNDGKMDCGAKSWNFLGQGFTGFGWCLNDNWQLTVGYRLRYLSGNTTWSMTGAANEVKVKMKQDLSHAAEVGLTYRF